MKFQKYIEHVQRTSPNLRHLDYKALKSEIKRLADSVQDGELTHDAAALMFGKKLEKELAEVGCSWEVHMWDLKREVGALQSRAEAMMRGDAAHDAFHSHLLPLWLLEILHEWIPIAASADALRKHRLLQITAVIKIEKKFVKVVGAQTRIGFQAKHLIARSALSGKIVHELCTRLESFGAKLLELGLGSDKAETEFMCSVCLSDITDPSRLPCGHRFCAHCVLPLFSHIPDEDAVYSRCPLCRAAGPQVPQALCLDSLVACLGRGLYPHFDLCLQSLESDSEQRHFTAVVVSSLARLVTDQWKLNEAGDSNNVPAMIYSKPPQVKSHDPDGGSYDSQSLASKRSDVSKAPRLCPAPSPQFEEQILVFGRLLGPMPAAPKDCTPPKAPRLHPMPDPAFEEPMTELMLSSSVIEERLLPLPH